MINEGKLPKLDETATCSAIIQESILNQSKSIPEHVMIDTSARDANQSESL